MNIADFVKLVNVIYVIYGELLQIILRRIVFTIFLFFVLIFFCLDYSTISFERDSCRLPKIVDRQRNCTMYPTAGSTSYRRFSKSILDSLEWIQRSDMRFLNIFALFYVMPFTEYKMHSCNGFYIRVFEPSLNFQLRNSSSIFQPVSSPNF